MVHSFNKTWMLWWYAKFELRLNLACIYFEKKEKKHTHKDGLINWIDNIGFCLDLLHDTKKKIMSIRFFSLVSGADILKWNEAKKIIYVWMIFNICVSAMRLSGLMLENVQTKLINIVGSHVKSCESKKKKKNKKEHKTCA